jgi:hypothetical protein
LHLAHLRAELFATVADSGHRSAPCARCSASGFASSNGVLTPKALLHGEREGRSVAFVGGINRFS